MKVKERIEQLRKVMEEKGVDAYVVPTADFHQSEYVGEYFKARKFITGFSGSAGTAVITRTEGKLWTDGRYFLQAGRQLEGTTVELMKMGEPGVPTITEYLAEALPEGGVLGFDGRVVSMGEGKAYEAVAKAKGGRVFYQEDLIDGIWTDRPAMSEEPAFSLELKYAGESTKDKLIRIREEMKRCHANVHILTTLDDICWTLNIRGNDIDFFPMVLTYAIITMEEVKLYVDERKLSEEMKALLAQDQVSIHPYNDIYEDVKKLGASDTALIDSGKLNYALYSNIPEGVQEVDERNPEILFKAMKNRVEIENIRKAQIKDSIAHVRFMKWLKENIGKTVITEISATEKLDAYRAEMGNFIRPSFEPISSFGEHAAIVHYTSSEETNVELKEGNLYLSDTGAGFYEGSTDVTRTFALGEIPQEMKEHFTLVAISNLQLANAKFLKGTIGMNLDILARKPFWDRDLNFNHGTGHGVGYLLNIHEGPTGFRWQYRPGESHAFEEGMVITDEPGIYIEGSHGVRLENELLVCSGTKNEYGQFMYFEAITLIPMDLDAIDPAMMTEEEKKLLNDYHKKVYDSLEAHLTEEEKEWLKVYTRAI
ncbi:aminopeptidase P family N-terminal domain-containing protein [Suipraeoptans intestinalis]|uniref:aminopeptidase P family N-terminal domain-containing protein n=1 Tax=Suipraeoptans intestinalis TaxID=2606628 RepID=UPI0023F24C22|nr:aminopeptidase P family N-terminal domain-containing protein [Suipraeoptans intestinalis]MDD7769464.1 aminopeptidase P family N-terminal domain-containing protein [Suipraeoptans intestinalis]MDY3122507.1 aminopeptidase P family N-terminal domain-containing protein [Suipraeoptans intestinalis]